MGDDPVSPAITCRHVEVAMEAGLPQLIHDSPHHPRLVRAYDVCMHGTALDDTPTAVSVPNIDSKPLEFLHVSKTAGTFFCQCMSDPQGYGFNKHLPWNESTNCHFLEEDRPMWGQHDVPEFALLENSEVHTKTCTSKLAAYKQLHIDVEGNENYVAKHGLCEEFLNVMFLRDPMSTANVHLCWK